MNGQLGWNLSRVCIFFSLLLSQLEANPWSWKEELFSESQSVKELRQYLFGSNSDDSRAAVTDGFLLIQGDRIRLEMYDTARGFSKETQHILWSVTKSLVSGLAGVTNKRGKITEQALVGDSFAELGSAAKKLTLRLLLSMRSCLSWSEVYENDPRHSSILALLYGPGRADHVGFVGSKASACEPGSRFSYSSGDANLAMGQIASQWEKFDPWELLFDPLGMKVTLESDAKGNYVGSSYGYTSARDIAKYARLFLNQGNWEGETLIDANWVNRATTHRDGNEGGYWWPNKNGEKLRHPDLPEDAFFAYGHWGQYVAVVPSQDWILVRFGDDRNNKHEKAFDFDKTLSLTLAVLAAEGGLASDWKSTRPRKDKFRRPSRKDRSNREPELTYWEIPPGLARFAAKEFCSCLYVMKLPQTVCETYVNQPLPLLSTSVQVESSTKTVHGRAKMIGVPVGTGVARHLDERHGCRLD